MCQEKSLYMSNEQNTLSTITSRVLKNDLVDWRAFKYIQHDTFKELPSSAKKVLKQSIVENSFAQPFYVWHDETTDDIYCLDGKHRTIILQELSDEGHTIPDMLPAIFIDCKNKKEAASFVLIYSSIYAKITEDGFIEFSKLYELDFQEMKSMIDLPGIDMIELESSFKDFETETAPIVAQSLAEKFGIPPFSIFDTRQGYWQERKRKWHTLFDSQASRENVELIAQSGQSSAVYELRNKMREQLGREPEWDEIIDYAKKKGLHIYEGASIFDPVLAEILYRWFCPVGGSILDPFAGGSVRGIVAGILGYDYLGIDLRPDQVKANEDQWKTLETNGTLKNSDVDVDWIAGDSNVVCDKIDLPFDFVFSCPPYHDLEQYSDDPADLSNMTYDEFCTIYRSIITKAMAKLKPERFACFVVGDIRDEKGFYKNFVSETIDCFTKCIDEDGAHIKLYNEIILINVAGSLPIRVGRQFENGRKVGKMHQNVLVFYKGDPKKIKENFPEINIDDYLINHQEDPNIAL